MTRPSLSALGWAKLRTLSGRMKYGDVVRFTFDHSGSFPLSDPVYDARFMWISSQYDAFIEDDIATTICIRDGGPWRVGDVATKNFSIFEVVE